MQSGKRAKHRIDYRAELLENRYLLANPTANAGGPYSLQERGNVLLTGSGSGSINTWQWDLNYSAAGGFQVDATGQNVTLNGNALDGPSTRTVALRVIDNQNRTALDTGVVNVSNIAPTAQLQITGAVDPGEPVTIALANPVDSQPDVTAGFTYAFDLDNNGSFETSTGSSSSLSAPDWLIQDSGVHPVRGRIMDKDGGSSIYTGSVMINSPSLQIDDWSAPEGSQITLSVAGSHGTDLTYSWDLDYHGEEDWYDGSGASIVFNTWGIDGPDTRSIGVRATDRWGNTAVDSATLFVTNVNPTIYVSMPPSGDEGGTHYIYTLAYESSPQDRQALMRQFDFNNDGVVDSEVNLGDGVYMPILPEFVADGPGTLKVRVRAIDDDGGFVDSFHSFTITNAPPGGTVSVDQTDVNMSTTIRVSNLSDPSPVDLASLRFSYDLNQDGVYDIIDSPSPQATIPAENLTSWGQHLAKVKIADKDGAFIEKTAYFFVSPGTVALPDAAPIDLSEGISVGLNGNYSLSTFATLTSLAWDIDYDGVTFQVDATTPDITLPAFDGPSQHIIAMRVTDSAGTVSIGTVVVNVTNLPPRATANSWPGSVTEGTTTANILLGGLTDPGPGDLESLRFSFDFTNDGVFDIVDSPANPTSIPASLMQDGPVSFTVRARVSDDDGGYTDYLLPINVTNVAPTITLSGAKSVDVNQPFTLGIAVADPGADSVSSIVVDWRDGATSTLPSGVFTATHTYTGSQRSVAVLVQVADEDGTFSKSHSLLIDGPPVSLRSTFALDTSVASLRGPRVDFLLSESVAGSLTVEDLVLRNLDTGETIPTTSGNLGLIFQYVEQSSARWRWPGGLPDGNYRATLPAGSFSDSTGHPSAADFSVDFYMLAGDANRDRIVDTGDFNILTSQFGVTAGSPRTFQQGDFNFSGYVDSSDFNILTGQYGKRLPSPSAMMRAAGLFSDAQWPDDDRPFAFT
jgi:hypothetical protein